MLDRNSPQPLHIQLEEIIKLKIENEEWQPSGSILSENELSKKYGISRMTVRSVITRLVHEGLLYSIPGKGTFVCAPKIVSKPLSQMGIREQLEQMGYETSTKLIKIEKVAAPVRIAKVLELDADAQVYAIKRLRYVREEPFSIHTSYLSVALCPDLETKDLEGVQLCDILEKDYHYSIVKIVETLESTTATSSEEKLLLVKKSAPLLLLEDIIFTKGDAPIEYSKVLFRGDKIKLKLEFNKPGF
jgi:GntR family transcriptional regulator